MPYSSAQELRNAALPLQNLLYFVHLHEARKGPKTSCDLRKGDGEFCLAKSWHNKETKP